MNQMSTGLCESPNRKYGLRGPVGSCAGSWIATASESSDPGAAAAVETASSPKTSSALDAVLAGAEGAEGPEGVSSSSPKTPPPPLFEAAAGVTSSWSSSGG